MPCGATQDGQVMVERSDRMWSTGEGNGKPLRYSSLENPMNNMKRQNDMRVFPEDAWGCQPLEGIHLSFTPVASIQNKANLLFHQLAFSYYSWGSQGKNTEVVCHSLLQWITFCQNVLTCRFCPFQRVTLKVMVSLP